MKLFPKVARGSLQYIQFLVIADRHLLLDFSHGSLVLNYPSKTVGLSFSMSSGPLGPPGWHQSLIEGDVGKCSITLKLWCCPIRYIPKFPSFQVQVFLHPVHYQLQSFCGEQSRHHGSVHLRLLKSSPPPGIQLAHHLPTLGDRYRHWSAVLHRCLPSGDFRIKTWHIYNFVHVSKLSENYGNFWYFSEICVPKRSILEASIKKIIFVNKERIHYIVWAFRKIF